MKVLFDIVHPAQVHFFKNLIGRLQSGGHEVLVAGREKDVALNLLDALGIDYVCISRKGSGLLGLARELLIRDWRFWRQARRFRPDVMVARVGISAGLVGRLMGVPQVIYDDMEHARLQASISLPFARYICTGLGYYRDLGKKHVRFRGSPVLSYLAPKYFTPDPEPIRQAGLDPEQGYILVRTVSWGATHDVGRAGTSEAELHELIGRLDRFGRVVISSEDPLPESLREYDNPAPVDQMHNLLAFAKLCLVEGGTMAAEAAVLGVPAICYNTYDFGYLRALEDEYQMIYRPGTTDEALEIAEELLQRSDLGQVWQEKRWKMLDESDDVVEFMWNMVERAVREHPVKKK